MSYEITLAANGKYLCVRVTGIINREIALQYGREARRLALQHSIEGYLIDVREAVNTGTLGANFQYAYKDLEDMGYSRHWRRAILVKEGDNSHDFIETVCRNAGYIVRLFTREDEAINWLNQS